MSLRVLMLTQWYDPEGGSAAQSGVIARALHRRGVEIEVMTGFPNYPSGRVAEGYRIRPYQREVLDGITVHRTPLWPSHDEAAAKRAANYLSWASAASVIAPLRAPAADSVLVHSTPATVGLQALALRRARGLPFVAHIQDLWPQTVVSSPFLSADRRQRIERPLHAMCDAIYRRAAAIAVTSPGMAPLIEARGIPSDRIHLAANWADEAIFRPVPRRPDLAHRMGLDRPFTVMYAGIFGPYQSLDTLLAAADLVRSRTDIGFALVGDGVRGPALREEAERRGLDNVTFVPRVPVTEMADVLALGDAQLVSLQDLVLFRATLPSKLQSVMAAGRPVIGAVTGDAAQVIDDAGCGTTVSPGDPRALADAVVAMADAAPATRRAMGEAARRHYEQNFSEDVSAKTLTSLLESAAATRTGAYR